MAGGESTACGDRALAQEFESFCKLPPVAASSHMKRVSHSKVARDAGVQRALSEMLESHDCIEFLLEIKSRERLTPDD